MRDVTATGASCADNVAGGAPAMRSESRKENKVGPGSECVNLDVDRVPAGPLLLVLVLPLTFAN